VPNKLGNGALCQIWFRCFRTAVWQPFLPRLCVIGFTYCQPFLIKKTVLLAGTPQVMPYSNWGYGVIGAYLLVYVGLSVSPFFISFCGNGNPYSEFRGPSVPVAA
jgi:ATP-binding cassette subfamily C (CFTR/MRP) protein 1